MELRCLRSLPPAGEMIFTTNHAWLKSPIVHDDKKRRGAVPLLAQSRHAARVQPEVCFWR